MIRLICRPPSFKSDNTPATFGRLSWLTVQSGFDHHDDRARLSSWSGDAEHHDRFRPSTSSRCQINQWGRHEDIFVTRGPQKLSQWAQGVLMELHTRVEQRAGGFRVIADVAAVGKQEVGPFSAREEAKIQEIKVRTDLRLQSARPTRSA